MENITLNEFRKYLIITGLTYGLPLRIVTMVNDEYKYLMSMIERDIEYIAPEIRSSYITGMYKLTQTRIIGIIRENSYQTDSWMNPIMEYNNKHTVIIS